MKDDSQEGPEPKYPIIKMPDQIILYQDRTKDGNASIKRFWRDIELLSAELKENPTDPRTLFYLSQSYQCTGQFEEALYYSKIRLQYKGFEEEIFHAYMRCADCVFQMGQPWEEAQKYYLQAYEFDNRCEPLVKIADYYRKIKKFTLLICIFGKLVILSIHTIRFSSSTRGVTITTGTT